MNNPSIAIRVIGFLVAAQLPAMLMTWAVTMAAAFTGFAGYRISMDDMAVSRTEALVLRSIVTTNEGRIVINPNAELRAEMDRVPQLKFAVFDPAGDIRLPGSSAQLSQELGTVLHLGPMYFNFKGIEDAASKSAGYLGTEETQYGPLMVAISGAKFHWTDIAYSLKTDLSLGALYSSGAISLTLLMAWLAVRRGLAPLSAVVGSARQIDMGSLKVRLPLDGVPREIKPLIEAMNDALIRLDASAARMRRYTANAAHELRTPLAIMRAKLESAQELDRAELMQDASHLQSIIDQLLISARLNEQQEKLDQRIDLTDAIHGIVSDHFPLAIESSRSIEFERPARPVVASGNKHAIERVVANLIDNALRAEPKGGAIVVRVRDDATVEVIDHGAGIAPTDREKIFEPFWSRSDKQTGAGLGLAIAKDVMEKLDGRIRVHDTPGGGATFELSFSAAENTEGFSSLRRRCEREFPET